MILSNSVLLASEGIGLSTQKLKNNVGQCGRIDCMDILTQCYIVAPAQIV